MKVLHFSPDLSVNAGGTSTVVVQLADALSDNAKIDADILTIRSAGPVVQSGSPRVVRNVIAPTRSFDPFFLLARSKILTFLSRSSMDLLHVHGLWRPVTHHVVKAAFGKKIPFVVQPHGMLEPWAINHKRFKKKKIAMAAFQRSDIEKASAIIATSKDEYRSVRSLEFSNPVAIIPNGVFFDEVPNEDRDITNKATRTVLFLSRIHPVKGLVNLVSAWAKLKPVGWRLLIAGPDEGGHKADILQLVRQLGIDQQVSFSGFIGGEEKRRAYLESDIFVLPTFSENFGVVIAEALSYGLPVITTKGSPWSDLEVFGCGWWVDIGVDPLAKALHDAISLSDHERADMGRKGMSYARRYSWKEIADQMDCVYRWVLGQSEKPGCVFID